MSSGNPISHRVAMEKARQVVEHLRPHCTRIEIAGSVRRGKQWVHDIEIVLIPRARMQTVEVKPATLLEEAVTKDVLIRIPEYAAAVRELGTVVKGVKLDEAKFTQVIDADGHTIDLFAATPSNWGYIFLIRTGPKEYSQGMLARGNKLGYHGEDGMWTRFGKPVEVKEERDMFAMLGIAYVQPTERG